MRKRKRRWSKKDIKSIGNQKMAEIQERNDKGLTLDKMWTLGFLVDNLQNSQMSYYLISKGNEYVKEHTGADIIAYYENLSIKVVKPHFAVLQIAESLNHNGPLVSTSIKMLQWLSRHQSNAAKYLYVWDLEFLRTPVLDESIVYNWYHNGYNIIARCDDYAKVLENNFDVKIAEVIPDFDISRFMSFIGKGVINGSSNRTTDG